MILTLIAIFGSVLAVLVIWWYYEFFKFSPAYSKYKGERPYPIVGNSLRIASTADIIPVLMDCVTRYGPDTTMWFGYKPRLIVCHHRTAELLLGSTNTIDKSFDYHFFEPWMGTGLLTSGGSKWRTRRKLLTPTFHFHILEQFLPIFDAQNKILIKKLQEVVDTGPVDIHSYINLLAIDIICEAAMGIQINAQEGGSIDYINSVHDMTNVVSTRTVSPLKMFDFLFQFTNDYQRQKRALAILHGKTKDVINSRQKKLVDLDSDANNEDDYGRKKRVAFLDQLLQCRVEGKPLPFESIREEVDTFMFEGNDTVTSGISFALYCLSQNLDVQEKVVEELRGIFASNDAPSTNKELMQMKYLEMVIKESMRLYPPVPIFARTFQESTEFDGTVFPKGSTFSVFLYGLHRQEEIFPDPERFDPQRFSTENCANRPPFAYVPFSAGTRNCIGQRFAMLEMKSTISKILRNFEVLPVPGYKPSLTTDAVLRAQNGILVNLKKRQF